MAYIIYTSGREEQEKPANGKTFTLEELQSIVGGYVQCIDLGREFMIVDEEGKLKNYKVNAKATAIYQASPYVIPGDTIVGDVLVCDCDMIL